MHREIDVRWNEEIDSAELEKLWEELKAVADGQEISRDHDGQVVHLKREGSTIVLRYAYDEGRGEDVTVRFPAADGSIVMPSDEEEIVVDSVEAEVVSIEPADGVTIRSAATSAFIAISAPCGDVTSVAPGEAASSGPSVAASA